MSSDSYPSNLSRNLVRTGTLGYRENLALCALLMVDRPTPGPGFRHAGPEMDFAVFPDFSGKAVGRLALSARRAGTYVLADSLEEPFSGTLSSPSIGEQ
jgi:hypothetical protein